MARNDVIELAGLCLLLMGAVALGYGLYLLATWLLFVVLGVSLMAAGSVAIYQANRGGA